MGQFEERSAQTKAKLPEDLPNAGKSVAEGHPHGAVFRANSGVRYRLVHPRWVEVKPRTKNGDKKKGSK